MLKGCDSHSNWVHYSRNILRSKSKWTIQFLKYCGVLAIKIIFDNRRQSRQKTLKINKRLTYSCSCHEAKRKKLRINLIQNVCLLCKMISSSRFIYLFHFFLLSFNFASNKITTNLADAVRWVIIKNVLNLWMIGDASESVKAKRLKFLLQLYLSRKEKFTNLAFFAERKMLLRVMIVHWFT